VLTEDKLMPFGQVSGRITLSGSLKGLPLDMGKLSYEAARRMDDGSTGRLWVFTSMQL
jgi:hypothetical protein